MKLFLVVFAMLLAGCASMGVPKSVSKATSAPLAPAEVSNMAAPPVGPHVRRGGTIAKTENRKDGTWLEIVARKLDKNGRPENTEQSEGRFLAYVNTFLEPTVFKEGRRITVVGTIEPNQRATVGEYPYVFPVVKVTEHYLWPRELPYAYAPPPPFWYDPWYPWGWGYPYHPYYYPW